MGKMRGGNRGGKGSKEKGEDWGEQWSSAVVSVGPRLCVAVGRNIETAFFQIWIINESECHLHSLHLHSTLHSAYTPSTPSISTSAPACSSLSAQSHRSIPRVSSSIPVAPRDVFVTMTATASIASTSPLPLSPPSTASSTSDDLRRCFQQLKPICVLLMEQQTQRRLHLANAAAAPSHQKEEEGEEETKGPHPPSPPSPHRPPAPPSTSPSSTASLLATLESLHRLLLSLPRLPLLHSLDYVLFPLISLLSQPVRAEKSFEAAVLSGLSSLCFLLRATFDDVDSTAVAAVVIGDEKGFAGLTHLMVALIRDAQSEEVRASAIECTTHLLTSATAHLQWMEQSPLRSHVLSSSFHISLGYLISLLLPCIASSSRALQLTALRSVSAACALLSPSTVGVSMLTSYMPGVLSALQKLLVRDDKAGTQVKAEAIRLMTDLIATVMGGEDVHHLSSSTTANRHHQPPPSIEEVDAEAEGAGDRAEVQRKIFHLRALVTSQSSSPTPIASEDGASLPSSGPAGPSAELLIPRDAAWFGETRERVSLMMRLVFAQSPVYPRSAALECQYVRSARRLLDQCGRVLRDCVIVWVEFVLAMTQHSHDEVREEAMTALSTFTTALSASTDAETSLALIHSLSSRLHYHLRSLPRLLQTSTEPAQLRLLHTASGYMQLLGSITSSSTPHESPLFALLSSPSAFPQLFIQLLPALRLHSHSPLVLDSPDDSTSPLHLLRSLHNQPSFYFAPDDSVRLALFHLLRGIGEFTGDQAGQLLDALLSFLPGEGGGRGEGHVEEWLVLIHQVIIGLTASSSAKASTPYLLLALDVFIQPELFSFSQSPNVLVLLLSGVATVAWHLQKEFEPYVMHLLFPLLSHLGSASVVVSSAAMKCLRVIAAALSLESVSALVLANVDYVVDAIAAHLLSAQPTPQLLLVMRAVLSRLPPSPQLIPLLRDTLDSIVRLLSVSTGGEEERLVCLEVLLGVVIAVRQWYEKEQPPLHPSARSGLFTSAKPINHTALLHEAEDYYSPRRVRERVARKREQHRREDAEQEDVERTAKERRVSPTQWFAQLEAKRERREERKAMGLRDEDTDSEDDEDERSAKEQHRKWRERERKDESVQPTAEQAVVIQLLRHAKSWIGRGGVREQVLVLDLIQQAVLVLHSIPKELFPLIAQLWPAVLALLRRYQRSGSSPAVSALTSQALMASGGSGVSESIPFVSGLLAGLELLAVLCEVASRFLATRFQSELWPVLTSVLTTYQQHMRSLVQLTAHQEARAHSPHTSAGGEAALQLMAPHRLLVSALSSLGFLLRYPDLMRQNVLEVVKACRPYIDESMPAEISEKACAVFRAAFTLNADVVEWVLSQMVDEDEDGEAEEGDVDLSCWQKVDEWGLDRRGELRLIWQRVKEERNNSSHQRLLRTQGTPSKQHDRAVLLLKELRALPTTPPLREDS